jgi:hypothetical protein
LHRRDDGAVNQSHYDYGLGHTITSYFCSCESAGSNLGVEFISDMKSLCLDNARDEGTWMPSWAVNIRKSDMLLRIENLNRSFMISFSQRRHEEH